MQVLELGEVIRVLVIHWFAAREQVCHENRLCLSTTIFDDWDSLSRVSVRASVSNEIWSDSGPTSEQPVSPLVRSRAQQKETTREERRNGLGSEWA